MAHPLKHIICLLLLGAVLETNVSPAQAGSATVAVAANFLAPAEVIVAEFAGETGHTVTLNSGSTGQLFTQISQGAPYDVFLAADQARPMRAEAEGLAAAGSRFTYAIGRLVLFSRASLEALTPETLLDPAMARIAVANPDTAPYGAAAIETLKALGLFKAVQPKLVYGTNIAQTYQFIDTGNASAGFVAASQLAGRDGGTRWSVPSALHRPIAQDAVLLIRGAENPAALAFLRFLKSDAAGAVLSYFGYSQ